MTTSRLAPDAHRTPVAIGVRIAADRFWVELEDGRVLGVPYARFPLLAGADDAERSEVVIGPGGRSLHWPRIDEDLGVELLLAYTPPA